MGSAKVSKENMTHCNFPEMMKRFWGDFEDVCFFFLKPNKTCRSNWATAQQRTLNLLQIIPHI